MEFVTFSEAWRELAEHGVSAGDGLAGVPPPPSELASLRPTLASQASVISLAGEAPADERLPIPPERLPEAIDLVLHKLHLAPVVVLPRTRWRPVLDAVTFSLADNAAWQEVESEAMVVLNTRDPLLCGAADLKTLRAMLTALVADGQREEESLAIVPVCGRILVEVSPGPVATMQIASRAIADSIIPLLRGLA